MGRTLIFVLSLGLGGCSLLDRVTAKESDEQPGAWRSAKIAASSKNKLASMILSNGNSQEATELRDALVKDYNDILQKCRALLSDQKQETDSARKRALGIQILGTIAGALFVPVLAARSTVPRGQVAGWGGVAGASNTLQNTVKEVGLAPAEAYNARNELRTSLLADIKRFNDLFTEFPSKYDQQIGILNGISAQCDLPPIPLPKDVTPYSMPSSPAPGSQPTPAPQTPSQQTPSQQSPKQQTPGQQTPGSGQ